MKKLFPNARDVPQGTANRGVRIIEKHLRMHRVDRAKDLPEEAQVRLLRDLREFYDAEAQCKGGEGPGGRHAGLWERFWARVEDFLSFSSLDDSDGLAICPIFGGQTCLLIRQQN